MHYWGSIRVSAIEQARKPWAQLEAMLTNAFVHKFLLLILPLIICENLKFLSIMINPFPSFNRTQPWNPGNLKRHASTKQGQMLLPRKRYVSKQIKLYEPITPYKHLLASRFWQQSLLWPSQDLLLERQPMPLPTTRERTQIRRYNEWVIWSTWAVPWKC